MTVPQVGEALKTKTPPHYLALSWLDLPRALEYQNRVRAPLCLALRQLALFPEYQSRVQAPHCLALAFRLLSPMALHILVLLLEYRNRARAPRCLALACQFLSPPTPRFSVLPIKSQTRVWTPRQLVLTHPLSCMAPHRILRKLSRFLGIQTDVREANYLFILQIQTT